jgi:DNA modification methylase
LQRTDIQSALETRHRILWGDATDMAAVADAGIDLVVTSPPYPMIEMWDRVFREQSAEAAWALDRGRGMAAFEAMHQVLDRVWRALWRVMRPGAIACINIGDAVRTIGGVFTLYPNHARIHSALLAIGFNPLPAVIWRKQTNAPNKFMGSGMLPAGAYVTLEHEFVLVARKGDKRDFSSASGKQRRHESAYFWEERNQWFSDVWFDLKGSRQKLSKSERHRSGAFPVELAYRLINMYALRGDTVLDPFLGTGSTMIAAMAAGRHSIGVEIDGSLKRTIQAGIDEMIPWANQRIDQRLADHRAFVAGREQTHGPLRHRNAHYGFPVVTGQERQLRFYRPVAVRNLDKDAFGVDYVAENPRPADAVAPPRTRRRSAESVTTAASSRGQSTLPGF